MSSIRKYTQILSCNYLTWGDVYITHQAGDAVISVLHQQWRPIFLMNHKKEMYIEYINHSNLGCLRSMYGIYFLWVSKDVTSSSIFVWGHYLQTADQSCLRQLSVSTQHCSLIGNCLDVAAKTLMAIYQVLIALLQSNHPSLLLVYIYLSLHPPIMHTNTYTDEKWNVTQQANLFLSVTFLVFLLPSESVAFSDERWRSWQLPHTPSGWGSHQQPSWGWGWVGCLLGQATSSWAVDRKTTADLSAVNENCFIQYLSWHTHTTEMQWRH